MKSYIKNNTSGFTLFELLIVLTVVIIIFDCFVHVNFSNGTGEKIGQVVKLSKQGFLRKTWEGQIIRGGMSGGSGAFGTVPFNFTVETDEMAQKVQDYMRSQTEVTIEYRIEGVYSPLRSGSLGHFLVSIQPSKPPVPLTAQ